MTKYVVATPTGFIAKEGEKTTLNINEATLTQSEVEQKTEGLTNYKVIEVNSNDGLQAEFNK
ncbi:hypothetical protein [Iningainema tapete]|uniref:Uncharacterized protein n=1 Tax=Iningainema tapete BLCC-T55 TaxID=2748662 RepID=A0A8J6XIZ8_9CYAN|nr:hypothetical protein [Iningainema tapete]MBD2771127.1 hypothetical protein [Iningainema tapete BLCC-T55]